VGVGVSLAARGSATFAEHEVKLVASLAEPLGNAIRVHAQRAGSASAQGAPIPGLMLFDVRDALVSANDEARAWLAELPAAPHLPTDLGVGVPPWNMALVFRARAIAEGRAGGATRARVRTERGAWLVCHG